MIEIIRDSREQDGFSFDGFDCTVREGTLTTGDYSVRGVENFAAVERKSLDDLIGCLMGENRARFERELSRARGLECFAVACEGSWQDVAQGRYRSRMNPHSALQSVLAFQVRYNVPFLLCGSRQAAAYVTFWLLHKYVEEAHKRFETLSKLVAA